MAHRYRTPKPGTGTMRVNPYTARARKVAAAGRRTNPGGAHVGWDVYQGRRWITKVFYVPSADADYVRRGLIDHDGLPSDIRVVREKPRRRQNPGSRHVHTLTAADVGRPSHRIAGRSWSVSSWIGRVLPQDVGKRVYLVGDILQVENDEQRAKRLAAGRKNPLTPVERADVRRMAADDLRVSRDYRRKGAKPAAQYFRGRAYGMKTIASAFGGRRRRNPDLVAQIRPGDLVTIVNRFGQQSRGRAVMRSDPRYGPGWVLNMGGAHGTPGLANAENIVKVQASKARHGGGSVPPQPRQNPTRVPANAAPRIKRWILGKAAKSARHQALDGQTYLVLMHPDGSRAWVMSEAEHRAPRSVTTGWVIVSRHRAPKGSVRQNPLTRREVTQGHRIIDHHDRRGRQARSATTKGFHLGYAGGTHDAITRWGGRGTHPERRANPVPKGHIEWLVNGLHVATPDAEVAENIRKRANATSTMTKRDIAQAVAYAVRVHRRNRDLATRVAQGRLSRRRQNPASTRTWVIVGRARESYAKVVKGDFARALAAARRSALHWKTAYTVWEADPSGPTLKGGLKRKWATVSPTGVVRGLVRSNPAMVVLRNNRVTRLRAPSAVAKVEHVSGKPGSRLQLEVWDHGRKQGMLEGTHTWATDVHPAPPGTRANPSRARRNPLTLAEADRLRRRAELTDASARQDQASGTLGSHGYQHATGRAEGLRHAAREFGPGGRRLRGLTGRKFMQGMQQIWDRPTRTNPHETPDFVGDVDHAANELELYTENTSEIYHTYTKQAFRRAMALRAAGKYTEAQGRALFRSVLNAAAARYMREFGHPQLQVLKYFPAVARQRAAASLESSFRAEADLGNLDAYLPPGSPPTRRGNPKRGPRTPTEHQLAIARKTVRMPAAMRGVMGGPTLAEAQRTLAAAKRRKNPVRAPGRRRGAAPRSRGAQELARVRVRLTPKGPRLVLSWPVGAFPSPRAAAAAAARELRHALGRARLAAIAAGRLTCTRGDFRLAGAGRRGRWQFALQQRRR